MSQPQETAKTQETAAPQTATKTRETTATETVVLYAAQDAQGRLFLTDDRSLLPPDTEDCRELTLAPTQVTWAMLQVEVEELCGRGVTICVGDYHYATPQRNTTLPPIVTERTHSGKNQDRREVMSSDKPEGTHVRIVGSLSDQVYSYEDETGRQLHWSVTAAHVFAQAKNEVFTISLSEMGVTLPLVRVQYQGLDERHALACDLSQPLLFVPLGDKVRLIDGWHRVTKALLLGVDVLPACFLTQEEADACLLWTAEPGQGIDWGQNETAPQGTTTQNRTGDTRASRRS